MMLPSLPRPIINFGVALFRAWNPQENDIVGTASICFPEGSMDNQCASMSERDHVREARFDLG